MARLVHAKPALAPPTPQQLTDLKERLKQCVFLEHAAALAGVPRRVLQEWILRGRAGDPNFVPFVDMIDLQLAELSDSLTSPIVDAARTGNLQASMWLYAQRIKPHEERALKKQFELEDRLEQRALEIEADADTGGDELAADLLKQLTQPSVPSEEEKH
jgi:hypothetical protein